MNARVIGLSLAVVVAAAPGPPAQGQEQLVTLPVVVHGLASGPNDANWISQLRFIRTGSAPVTVRRVWVATEEGGWVDDPDTAPRWTLDDPTNPIRLASGDELLYGVPVLEPSLGAVQLAITGDAYVLQRIVDLHQWGLPDPIIWGLFFGGPGQMVPALEEAFTGPTFIPWMAYPPWFRNNVGLVNPNDGPMSFTLRAVETGWISPPMTVTLPGYGFLQVNRVLDRLSEGLSHLVGHAVVNIEPEDSRPYYAYGSLVDDHFNDPQFVPAVAGSVGNH